MRLPGPFHISRVVEFERPFRTPDHIFPEAQPALFAETRVAQDSRFYDPCLNSLIMGFFSLIVKTARNVILVDTCVGNHKERPRNPDWHLRRGSFLEDLASAGCAPENVTHVLCTHLHADHVGWNTRLIGGRWIPTFPNARYLMARTEVEHWQAEELTSPTSPNHGSWHDSVQPIFDAGQAVVVDSHYEIEPGVKLLPAPGHTPGNVMLSLDDGTDRAFLIGDTIHHPVQIERPEWSSRFCWDPQLAANTRVNLLENVANTKAWIVPAHFPAPTGLQIAKQFGKFRYL